MCNSTVIHSELLVVEVHGARNSSTHCVKLKHQVHSKERRIILNIKIGGYINEVM